MKETLRWFGPSDSVSLKNILQSGATGVVTSLDHIKTGDVWSYDEILKRKDIIESNGLDWSVVESVPLHNDIKTMSGKYKIYINNYKKSIENIGKAGIKVICYNFMAVLDWTRTNLRYELKNKSLALRFDTIDFAAYDLFILKRENAEKDYNKDVRELAENKFYNYSQSDKDTLERNIISGLPGGEGSYSRNKIKSEIDKFSKIGTNQYRQNLFDFLNEIIPVAEASLVKMSIHPDDPPFPLFGLPRVVSNADDLRKIIDAHPSIYNGLTMCVGSLASSKQNSATEMIREFSAYIHFIHLRNIIKEPNGSFYESDHLGGDVDMHRVIKQIIREENYRLKRDVDSIIPMRPDHGHLIGYESSKNVNPGYSFAGRLKGLSELRGVIHSLNRA